ncbi:MAG: cell envelope integrity protein TolA [Parvularculales bacterium]
MRGGYIFSALLHLAVLFFSIIGLPQLIPPTSVSPELMVELVNEEDLIEEIAVRSFQHPEPEPEPELKREAPTPLSNKKTKSKRELPTPLTNKKSISTTPQSEPEQQKGTTSLTARETVDIKRAIKTQMARCWAVPRGAPDTETLVVTIKIFLKPDGYLAAAPESLDKDRLALGNSYFRSAVETAIRAIRQCQPFDLSINVDKYKDWREMVLRFDPRAVLNR